MKHTHAAFTLSELLVVVAIVGLLLALLLPALEQAKQRANTSACLSVHRQLGVAYFGWVTDNDGKLLRPETSGGGQGVVQGGINVYNELAHYLGAKYVWSDPGADEPANPANRAAWHYGIHNSDPSVFWRGGYTGYAAGYPAQNISDTTRHAPVYRDELPYPASTGLFACKIQGWYPISLGAGDNSPRMNAYHNNFNRPWPLHGTRRLTFDGQTSWVRMDGSTRTYAWKELVSWTSLPYLGTAPTGYEGVYNSYGIPRCYIWSGYLPAETVFRKGGWLAE